MHAVAEVQSLQLLGHVVQTPPLFHVLVGQKGTARAVDAVMSGWGGSEEVPHHHASAGSSRQPLASVAARCQMKRCRAYGLCANPRSPHDVLSCAKPWTHAEQVASEVQALQPVGQSLQTTPSRQVPAGHVGVVTVGRGRCGCGETTQIAEVGQSSD